MVRQSYRPCPEPLAAEDLPDALMAQAHAEQRDLPGQLADGGQRHAPVPGPSRSRRDQHRVGILGPDPGDVDGVVAEDDRRRAQLTQLLDEVVDERVVVVEDEYPRSHGAMVTEAPGAAGPG